MSAAVSKACIVCQASSSKYKCPKCTGPTCSLICSKKHKGDVHPDTVLDGASTSSNTSSQAYLSSNASEKQILPPLQQFSNSNEKINAPAAHNFGNIDKFIPMNAYGEANMMEDFEYLQFMGRSIATLGRDLIKKGWYKESEQDNDAKNPSNSNNQTNGRNSRTPSKNQGGRFNNSSEKLSSEARNRQQYEQSIRRLKVPIMLLPDGMLARKENQTRFKAQQQQLMCTIQINFPSGNYEDRRSKRIIQHHIPWSKAIGEIVRSEISKRLRVNIAKGKGTSDETVEINGDEQVSAWEALFGKQKDKSGDTNLTSFEDIRNQVTIAIPVHSEKLRNETSARFLEWWQRQVRNGMVLEGGLKFDEEKKVALEKRRNGEWAPIEGLATDDVDKEEIPDLTQPITIDSMEQQSGLISSFLLSRLQSQRDIQKKRESDMIDTKTQEDAKNSEEEISQTATRHLVVLQGKESIEDVLRRLTKGYAIVEYPHIEVWESEELSQKFANGTAERVQLSPVDGDEGDEAFTAVDKNVSKRSAEDALNTDSTKKIKVDTIRPQNSSTSALVGLSAYASSDEESEDDAEVDDNGKGEDVLEKHHSMHESNPLKQIASSAVNDGSLANIARSLGMTQSPAEED